jgi:hypothetical protein
VRMASRDDRNEKRSVGLFWLVSRMRWPGGRDGSGDLGGTGPAFGESQAQASVGGGQPADDSEEVQAETFRFPATGVAGQCEHLHSRGQVAGQRYDFAPDLVLRAALERQVPQLVRCPSTSADG